MATKDNDVVRPWVVGLIVIGLVSVLGYFAESRASIDSLTALKERVDAQDKLVNSIDTKVDDMSVDIREIRIVTEMIKAKYRNER